MVCVCSFVNILNIGGISKTAGDIDSIAMEHLQEMAYGELMTTRDPLRAGGVVRAWQRLLSDCLSSYHS